MARAERGEESTQKQNECQSKFNCMSEQQENSSSVSDCILSAAACGCPNAATLPLCVEGKVQSRPWTEILAESFFEPAKFIDSKNEAIQSHFTATMKVGSACKPDRLMRIRIDNMQSQNQSDNPCAYGTRSRKPAQRSSAKLASRQRKTQHGERG